ncbi:MAG TPA: hypothetical protein VH815_13050, partial [Acidobacteriota bacterium]
MQDTIVKNCRINWAPPFLYMYESLLGFFIKFFPFFLSSRSCFSHDGYLLNNDIYSLSLCHSDRILTQPVSDWKPFYL